MATTLAYSQRVELEYFIILEWHSNDHSEHLDALALQS
jgi:hypothetical protein